MQIKLVINRNKYTVDYFKNIPNYINNITLINFSSIFITITVYQCNIIYEINTYPPLDKNMQL